MLLAIGAAAVAVIRKPHSWGPAAGLLLGFAIAANAAAALNHPLLVEYLDLEEERRERLIDCVLPGHPDDLLSNPSSDDGLPDTKRVLGATALTGRVSSSATEAGERAGLLRGWLYLKFGAWLVGWSALGVVFGIGGSIGRRLLALGLFSLAGVTLAGLVCQQRLRAEYHWERAKLGEAACNYRARANPWEVRSGCSPNSPISSAPGNWPASSTCTRGVLRPNRSSIWSTNGSRTRTIGGLSDRS